MELSVDVLTELVLHMSLTDILSIATTNSRFRDQLLAKEANDNFAIEHGFPFDLTFTELKKYEKMSLNDRLQIASSLNDTRLVKKLTQLGADNLIVAMKNGMIRGNIEIVKFLFDEFPSLWKISFYDDVKFSGIIDAAKLGNFEVINFFLSKVNLKEKQLILNYAASCNNDELVKFMVDQGMSLSQIGIDYIVSNCNLELLKYVIKKAEYNYNNILYEAANWGCPKIMIFAINMGATPTSDVVDFVVGNKINDEELIRLLISKTTIQREIEELENLLDNL